MRKGLIVLATVVAALGGAGSATADVVDDNLAAVSRAPGDVLVFARGGDGTLLMRSGLDGDGTWSSTGRQVSSGPSATVRPDGTVEVFARGMDDRIVHASLKGSTWSDWEALDGTVTSAPAAGQRRGTGIIDLFVRGDDGRLHHRTWNADRSWSPYGSLGGDPVGAPTTASRLDNFVDVYVQGPAGGTFGQYFDGSQWSGYFDYGRATLSSPAAVAPPQGKDLHVFIRAQDRALHLRSHLDPPNQPNDWAQVDPRTFTSSPAAVADGDRIHVLARDGGQVIVKTRDGNGWSGWRSIGPAATPPPPQAPPAPSQPPAAPVDGGSVRLGTGLSCTPRGQAVKVSVSVRKRAGRAKPRVQKVVFFYRKGKRKIARTDRTAPYRKAIPVDLATGTYRVYARIHYKRPGKRKLGVKTVSKRFAVCR